MKKPYYFLFTILFITSISQAQSLDQVVIANSGLTISNASNTLSFTLGEPVIGNIANGESLNQGFWSSAISEIVLGVEDFLIESQTLVYPNPVNNELQVRFKDVKSQDVKIAIYDTNGKKLYAKNLAQDTFQTIDFSTYTAGIYVLKITQNSNNKTKTFKIIKQ